MRRGRLGAAILALGLAASAYAPCAPLRQPAFDARRLDAKPAGAAWTGADLLAVAIARNPQIAEARARRHDDGETVWRVRTELAKARADLNSARIEMVLATLAAAVRAERAQQMDRQVEAGEDVRPLADAAQGEALAASRRLAVAAGRRDAAVAALAGALGASPMAVRDLNLAPTPQARPRPAAWPRSVARRSRAAVDAAAAALATAQDRVRRVRDHDLPLAQRAHEAVALSLKAGKAGKAGKTNELAAQAAVLDAQLALLEARRAAATASVDLEAALRRAFDPAEEALIRTAMTPAIS